MTDYILRYVEDVGYLPILRVDNAEVYRGEYHDTYQGALDTLMGMASIFNGEDE